MIEIWSIEAEQSVLGAVMLDPSAFDRIGDMPASVFFRHQHGDIWRAASALHAAGKPSDVVAVADAMNGEKLEAAGGIKYLNDLCSSIPSARNAKHWADIVRDRAAQRALNAALCDALDLVDGAGTASEKLERVSALIQPLHSSIVRKAPRSLAEVALKRTEHYSDLQDGKIEAGWSTGLPALDKMLGGGLKPGKLIFLGARPSVGKTSLSAQMLIEQAKQGRKGLMFSQEMSAEEVGDRAVAHLGRVDYGRLQTGELSRDDWGRVVEAVEQCNTLPMHILDQGSLTLGEIRHQIRAMPGLKVVVLDYLQLCAKAEESGASNRNSEIEEISRGLKALALELGICLIVLSQLNRKVEERANKKPILADLRDSGSIEQDADVVLFLWPVRDLASGRLVGLDVAKNRQGRTGELGLNFYGAVQRWEESQEPIHQQQERTEAPSKHFRA